MSNLDIDALPGRQEVAWRTPRSKNEITTESPIVSLRIISERACVSAVLYTKLGDPIRLTISDDATVKDMEIIIDPHNPMHVIINTY